MTIQRTWLISISLLQRSIALWFAILYVVALNLWRHIQRHQCLVDILISLYQSMRESWLEKVNNVDSFIIYFFFISFYLYSIQAIFRECFWSFFLFQMKVQHFIKSHNNFSLSSVIPHHHWKMCCLLHFPIVQKLSWFQREFTTLFSKIPHLFTISQEELCMKKMGLKMENFENKCK